MRPSAPFPHRDTQRIREPHGHAGERRWCVGCRAKDAAAQRHCSPTDSVEVIDWEARQPVRRSASLLGVLAANDADHDIGMLNGEKTLARAAAPPQQFAVERRRALRVRGRQLVPGETPHDVAQLSGLDAPRRVECTMRAPQIGFSLQIDLLLVDRAVGMEPSTELSV
jgi:hypothetical protein